MRLKMYHALAMQTHQQQKNDPVQLNLFLKIYLIAYRFARRRSGCWAIQDATMKIEINEKKKSSLK